MRILKLFERIGSDIKRGENIDLYATILIAFIMVTLNIFGIATPELATVLTLSVLGLLAISSLGNRHHLEELGDRITRGSGNFFLDRFPSTFNEDFMVAKELWLVGTSLYGLLGDKYSILEKKLRNGDKLKALVVHPEKIYTDIISNRAYARTNSEQIQRRINDSLQMLCDLKKSFPKTLEIKTIKYPITYGGFFIDIDSATGSMYFENYPYKTESAALPKFVIRAENGYWYDFYKSEIKKLWENAEDWMYLSPDNVSQEKK